MIIHYENVFCAVCGATGAKNYEPCYKSLVQEHEASLEGYRIVLSDYQKTILRMEKLILRFELETNQCDACGGTGRKPRPVARSKK